MPLFTVVVPTYDRPAMLREALQSVRAQTCPDFECIVVEDAPPASSIRMPADTRFRLIRHPRNRGVAAARNTGIVHATGSFVTFLDDDDVYTADRLEIVQTELDGDHVVVCRRGGINGGDAHDRQLHGDARDWILDGFTPHLGQATIPRASCPLFDERYVACQDIEWWLRVSHQLEFRSVEAVGYLMRTHDGLRHGNDKSARAVCSQMLLDQYAEYFRSHPRAHAFRLERLARLQHQSGERAVARSTAFGALRARPGARRAALAFRLLWR